MKPDNKPNGETDPVSRLRPEDFWAKTIKDANRAEVPGISVRDHCLNVGCVAVAKQVHLGLNCHSGEVHHELVALALRLSSIHPDNFGSLSV